MLVVNQLSYLGARLYKISTIKPHWKGSITPISPHFLGWFACGKKTGCFHCQRCFMTDMVCRKFGYPQIYWIIIINIIPIITSINRAMSVVYPIFRDIPTYHLKMYIKWTNHSKSLLITINHYKSEKKNTLNHHKSPNITKTIQSNHPTNPIKSP